MVHQYVVTIFVLAILFCAQTQSLFCNERQFKHNDMCCDKCPQGTFVAEACSAGKTTKCGECQNGTYNDDWTHRRTCKTCSLGCGAGRRVAESCTSKSDTQCECIAANHFYSSVYDYCVACISCNQGTYPNAPCTKKTTCLQCPRGTFSNQSRNYVDKCAPCTTCDKYKRHCSATQDSICDLTTVIAKTERTTNVPSIPWTPTTSTTVDTSTVEVEPATRKEKFSFEIIIITIVIVVILVVVLAIIYVTRRKVRCRDHFAQLPREPSVCEKLNTGILLRDATNNSRIIMGVHHLINPDSSRNWKRLAVELGFNFTEIANFAVNRGRSTEDMLAAWQTKNGSSVDVLHEALLKIGRCDAANLVASCVVQSQSDIAIV